MTDKQFDILGEYKKYYSLGYTTGDEVKIIEPINKINKLDSGWIVTDYYGITYRTTYDGKIKKDN